MKIIPKHINIYTSVYKDIENIQDIYKKRASGPGWAAAAWPPPGILYISCIYCIYLHIFVYIWVYLILNLYELCINWMKFYVQVVNIP